MKKFSILFVAFVSGCSLLNPLVGYERTFRNHLDKMIGEEINILVKRYPGTLHTERGRKYSGEVPTEITFYRFGLSRWSGEELNCEWVMKVDSEGVVNSWEYVSTTDQCHQPYFHEGPF